MKKIAQGNSSVGRIAQFEGGRKREKINLATWAHQRVTQRGGIDDTDESAPFVASPVSNVPSPDTKPAPAPKKVASGRKTHMADLLLHIERPPLPQARKKEPMQRLAVDIPARLHATIKRVADRPGGSLRDDVAALLEWWYEGTPRGS